MNKRKAEVWYRDTESGAYVSIGDLRDEFESARADDEETYDYSFGEFLNNCLSKNGFLDVV